ncbi:unnamed protein product [Caenorhabditis auriculariae]|uniref:LRRCT domain-containing protein n=1 Tax=Caenorhabditis auriculariae TaxID=2777116 RepID=A0A8S1GM46_9PELO|nr:unnamed protein product [Caenorhabditis auriculariae]
MGGPRKAGPALNYDEPVSLRRMVLLYPEMRRKELTWIFLLLIGLSAACQHGCQCSNFVAVCRGASLRSMPILLDPRTTVLDLSDNRITRISGDELGLYPNLERLILRNNSLTHLREDVFAAATSLRVLDLSSNSLLSLPNSLFQKLRNLEELVIASNDVQLGSESFAGLSSLMRLSLADNRLSFLPPAVFRPLKSLKDLDVSANKLLDMPASLLTAVPGLTRLDLRRNLLSKLETGMFAAQKELKWLDLSENLVGDIEEGAFYGLEQLQTLNLTSNQLVRLPGNSWPLPHLRVLDISSNLFVSLETASFDSLPNLKYLNISSSRNLKSVQMAAFVSLASLEWLSLRSSALTRLHASSFTPHPPLVFFDLSNNQLKTLPIGMLPYEKIATQKLGDNPWTCDCAFRSLRLRPADSVVCLSPENLDGVALEDLGECVLFGGLLIPIVLTLAVLLLAVVVLLLACKRPATSKSRAFYNDASLINVLSHKEYTFDRSSTPYTQSEDSSDSAYESPTSVLVPRRPPPSAPPKMTSARMDGSLPAMIPSSHSNNYHDAYLIPTSQKKGKIDTTSLWQIFKLVPPPRHWSLVWSIRPGRNPLLEVRI